MKVASRTVLVLAVLASVTPGVQADNPIIDFICELIGFISFGFLDLCGAQDPLVAPACNLDSYTFLGLEGSAVMVEIDTPIPAGDLVFSVLPGVTFPSFKVDMALVDGEGFSVEEIDDIILINGEAEALVAVEGGGKNVIEAELSPGFHALVVSERRMQVADEAFDTSIDAFPFTFAGTFFEEGDSGGAVTTIAVATDNPGAALRANEVLVTTDEIELGHPTVDASLPEVAVYCFEVVDQVVDEEV